MVVNDVPLRWYVDKIMRDEYFSLGLYGDGEFIALFRERLGGKTSEGETYVVNMTEELERSFDLQGAYYFGTAPVLQYVYGAKMQDVLKRHERETLEFVNGEIFDYAVRLGQLGPFIKALRTKSVVIVGNEHLRKLDFLRPAHFVEIPMHTAYQEIDRIERECLEYGQSGMYLISAGLTAIPLITRLYEKIPQSWFLDMGSIWDIFVDLGHHRGWRAEAYADPEKLQRIRLDNLQEI